MKKILAMILALTLVAGLAACKHDTQDNTTENMTESTAALETTEPSSEAAEPSTEATEPSSEATEPSSEATEPSTEPTEPTEEPAGITVEEAEGQRHYYLADGTKFCTELLDDAGRLIRREAYRDGELHRVWKYEYEDDGDLDWVKYLYHVDGDNWGWQYGGDTMVTEVTDQGLEDTFYEDGVVSAVVSYTCDWVLWEARYRDGLPAYSCEYDTDGSCITETHYENGLAFWSIRYGEVDETAFYDDQGRMIQQFGIESWREIWCRSFTYDDAGNLIDETLEETADNESIDERRRYVYDGDRVRAYTAQEGLVYSARYDELGRIVGETSGCPYGKYGEYTDHTSYEYNDDGSYTTTWRGATCGRYYGYYDKDGNLLEYCGDDDPGEDPMEMGLRRVYEYNEQGDRISFDEYEFGELKSSRRFEYIYDENGNWIEMVSYRDGEQAARTFRTYDDQGRVTEKRSESGGYRCTYTYDDAGNLTEMQEMWGDETDIYTYIYDESGRLTQEIRRSISD